MDVRWTYFSFSVFFRFENTGWRQSVSAFCSRWNTFRCGRLFMACLTTPSIFNKFNYYSIFFMYNLQFNCLLITFA